MTLFLQFVGPLGEPVYVRPERVDGVREIALTVGGRPVRGAMVLLANRETFRVQGSADAIAAAVEGWQAERDSKYQFGTLVAGITPENVHPEIGRYVDDNVDAVGRIR